MLGNGSSTTVSRAKNKAVVVKRRKEVVVAKDYNSFNCGTVQASHANACASGSLSNTFYHNGAQAQPAVNDIIYSSRRARVPNKMTAGYYKIFDRRDGTIQINDQGVVTAKVACP
tara:strand:+ start:456 stop:800 length:345 start_codon:yes stop_codon:yes gene_type:complete